MVACKIDLTRKTGEVVCKTEVPSPRQLERCPLDLDSDESDSSELADAEKNVENEFHGRLPETLVRNRADADAEKNVKTSDGPLLTLGGIPDELVDCAKAVDASECFEEFKQTVVRYQERFKEKTKAMVESLEPSGDEPVDIYQIAKETGVFDIRSRIGQQF